MYHWLSSISAYCYWRLGKFCQVVQDARGVGRSGWDACWEAQDLRHEAWFRSYYCLQLPANADPGRLTLQLHWLGLWSLLDWITGYQVNLEQGIVASMSGVNKWMGAYLKIKIYIHISIHIYVDNSMIWGRGKRIIHKGKQEQTAGTALKRQLRAPVLHIRVPGFESQFCFQSKPRTNTHPRK